MAGVLDINPSIVNDFGKKKKESEETEEDRPKPFEAHTTEPNETKEEKQSEALTNGSIEPLTNGSTEPLSDLDFVSSQSSQYVMLKLFNSNL